MSRRAPNKPSREGPRLSEDWLSVIVGLALVLIVALFHVTSVPWPLFGVFK